MPRDCFFKGLLQSFLDDFSASQFSPRPHPSSSGAGLGLVGFAVPLVGLPKVGLLLQGSQAPGGRESNRVWGQKGDRGSRPSPQRLLVPTGHRRPLRAWPRAAKQERAPEHEAIPTDTIGNKCFLFRRSAVEEGKGIFHNIKNFVRFQLST